MNSVLYIMCIEHIPLKIGFFVWSQQTFICHLFLPKKFKKSYQKEN